MYEETYSGEYSIVRSPIIYKKFVDTQGEKTINISKMYMELHK
jgi:hypothetical protein